MVYDGRKTSRSVNGAAAAACEGTTAAKRRRLVHGDKTNAAAHPHTLKIADVSPQGSVCSANTLGAQHVAEVETLHPPLPNGTQAEQWMHDESDDNAMSVVSCASHTVKTPTKVCKAE